VARAKRTQRAEARRRYRATNAPIDELDPLDSTDPAPTRKAASSSATGTPARVGMAAAFRASFRPLNVREDLVALPWIATHTHAIWAPLAVTLVGSAATAVAGANDMVTSLLFTYFVMFPAIGSLFLGGFLAPRASWLVGAIVGLFSAVCYVVLGLTSHLPPGFQTQFALTPDLMSSQAILVSPVFGAFFAAAAAWYRRFLRFSSPNRARRDAQKTSSKRTADGRSRTSGTSQKAPAKR
jgi:hypothetical protein